ncbi:hypothetical protein [Nannocystis pusilla]|uniref:M61 family metallopeptidase n=1 Tax=Nannocystis pusilla TaxID=889268 RepID=UPI003B76F35C
MFEKDALVALQVELRLRGDADGLTRLKLPDHWGTARELWTLLRDFTVEGATVTADDDPSIRQLAAAPNAPVVVRYRVVSGFDRDPHAQDGQPFLPIIRPTWFDVFGEALFAYPEGREDDPASFVWRDAPAGSSRQRPRAPGRRASRRRRRRHRERRHRRPRPAHPRQRPGPRGDPRRLRLHTRRLLRPVPGRHRLPARVLGRQGRPVPDHPRAAEADRGQHDLRRHRPLRRLHPHRRRERVDRRPAPPPRPRVLPHLERAPARRPGRWHRRGRRQWFAEGFTEFYTWRLLLRAGIYGLEDFVTAWNEALHEYWTSPVRDEPNARIVADYWNDHAVSRLPYRRGPLLAAIWEQRLRQATAGARDLDDVLQAMRAKVQASPVKFAPDAASVFPPVYRELGGPDIAADLERFVDQGTAIRMPADVFGPCVRVVDSVRRNFERGWDVDATAAAGHVAGLRKGSAAWRAGLRDGMKILERDGKPDDSTVPYVLRVRDGKRERVIRFKPEGEREIPLQQLELAPGLTPERRAACARELSGA